MNKSAAFGYGGNHREKWEIIDIEPRERHRMNFIYWSNELGFFNG